MDGGNNRSKVIAEELSKITEKLIIVNCRVSGVARDIAIGQLPNAPMVIAQGYFWDDTNCPLMKTFDEHVSSQTFVMEF